MKRNLLNVHGLLYVVSKVSENDKSSEHTASWAQPCWVKAIVEQIQFGKVLLVDGDLREITLDLLERRLL